MKRSRKKKSRNRAILLLVALTILILTASTLYYFTRPVTSTVSFASVAQVSQYTTEFPTQSPGTSPNAISVDSNGIVWFALWNVSSIGELIPSNGTIHEFPLPGVKASAMISWGMTVDNTHRRVWLTEYSSNSIWSFDIGTHKFTQYKLSTPNSYPFGITLDKNQNVWFTELEGNKIGEITASGTLSELSVPISNSEPSGIVIDPLERAWFTLPGADSIGSYFDGNFTMQNFTGLASTPVGITVDSKGNLWFTQHGPSFVSEYNPASHYLKTISTSNNSLPSSLPYFCWVDENGNVWFNEHQGNAMGEFFPQNNTLVEYLIPTRIASEGNISYMLTSAVSPSGEPWYTELYTGKIGTINVGAPVMVHLKLLNYSSSNDAFLNGSSNSYGLAISSNSLVSLKAYVGNFTSQGNFSFTFSPRTGNGNFNTVLTIQNRGALPGVYFFTITARTDKIAVSQIIDLTVR
jgi:virginiamycin B lyase